MKTTEKRSTSSLIRRADRLIARSVRLREGLRKSLELLGQHTALRAAGVRQ